MSQQIPVTSKEQDAYDKMINDTVESMKRTNPQRYLRAQNIGDTLMNINLANFEKGIGYQIEGNNVDNAVMTNIDVKSLLQNMIDYNLSINDLTINDIELLKETYGDNWRNLVHDYINSNTK